MILGSRGIKLNLHCKVPPLVTASQLGVTQNARSLSLFEQGRRIEAAWRKIGKDVQVKVVNGRLTWPHVNGVVV